MLGTCSLQSKYLATLAINTDFGSFVSVDIYAILMVGLFAELFALPIELRHTHRN